MTLVDFIFLCGPFGVLYLAAVDGWTHLVPHNDGTEDTLVELFKLARLVFGTLIIRLGHVEVSLRVGNAFYVSDLSTSILT